MLMFLIAFPISIIYFRDGTRKLTNIYKFYEMICEYKVAKNSYISKLLASILASLDLVICGCLLMPQTRNIGCVIGIILEIIYLIIMIKRFGKEFEKGCNCYTINNALIVDHKLIGKIIFMIFIFCILLIL